MSVDPRAVRRHHDPMDLVTLAQQVQRADDFVQATTSNKLKIIVDQIKHLQQQVDETELLLGSLFVIPQALEVLQSAKKDAQLHHATCNFKKIPGHMYHLYERSNGSTYFSMLSPQVPAL